MDALYDKVEKQEATYKKRNKRRYGKEDLTIDQQAAINAMYDQIDNLHTYGGVFSTGFATTYTKLASALRSKDQAKINATLEQIDADYGPFFIARAVLGGSLNMNCWLSNSYLKTAGTLDVKAALEGEGMFKVNGTLNWSQKGLDAVRNSRRTYDIYGGKAKQRKPPRRRTSRRVYECLGELSLRYQLRRHPWDQQCSAHHCHADWYLGTVRRSSDADYGEGILPEEVCEIRFGEVCRHDVSSRT